MTSFRFRVKASWNPRGLYRDIVIGSNRTLEDLHKAINNAFGLDFDHWWFFGTGQDYWHSPVKYVSPTELEDPDKLDEWLDFFAGRKREKRNAAVVTIKELNLSVRDRLCYVFDYGDDLRFYMIVEEKKEDGRSDMAPVIVKRMGDDIDEYPEDEDEDEDYPSLASR